MHTCNLMSGKNGTVKMTQVIIAKVIMAKCHIFNIRVWGGGWGVWNGGLEWGLKFGDLGKFNIGVSFLPTFPSVSLLPVPFLPAIFICAIFT